VAPIVSILPSFHGEPTASEFHCDGYLYGRESANNPAPDECGDSAADARAKPNVEWGESVSGGNLKHNERGFELGSTSDGATLWILRPGFRTKYLATGRDGEILANGSIWDLEDDDASSVPDAGNYLFICNFRRVGREREYREESRADEGAECGGISCVGADGDCDGGDSGGEKGRIGDQEIANWKEPQRLRCSQ